jgi:hypothetical protein
MFEVEMNVLVACEESQTICKAFRELGHNAYSCDIVGCSGGHPEWHIKDDAIKIAYDENYKWDLMIAHPPCTYLTNINSFMNRGCSLYTASEAKELRKNAVTFFMALVNAPIQKKCIENPVGYMNSHYRKPDQIIRPYQFGETSSKGTCLWLYGLHLLVPTDIKEPTYHVTKNGRVFDKWYFDTSLISDLKKRAKVRSKTFQGIANAMANQWGSVCLK